MLLSNFPTAEVSQGWGRHPQTADVRAHKETSYGNNTMQGTRSQTQQLNYGA